MRKSADLLKQAVEAQPDNAECRFWLGLALLRSGDARGAIEHLDRAAQLRDDPEFLKVLGEAEYQMRRWDDAIPHLEQALSKGVPNREETAILLAKAQARSGRRAEARVTLEELVRRNPHSANAISELVEMYLDDGDYARAVGICEGGLRANARNWSVYVRLAEPDFRPIVPQWEFVRSSVAVDRIEGKERDVVSAIVSFMDGAIGRLTFVETLQEHLAPKP